MEFTTEEKLGMLRHQLEEYEAEYDAWARSSTQYGGKKSEINIKDLMHKLEVTRNEIQEIENRRHF